MQKKAKQTYTGLAVVIIIIAGIWLAKNKANAPENQNTQTPSPQSQNPNAQPSTPASANSDNVWTGVLKASDNSKKGNLMLATPDHLIYIRTSRDFTSLLDKKVQVAFKGSMENFTLADITAE